MNGDWGRNVRSSMGMVKEVLIIAIEVVMWLVARERNRERKGRVVEEEGAPCMLRRPRQRINEAIDLIELSGECRVA